MLFRSGGFTMSGDATVTTSSGVITVTKTNGTSFAPSATTDTTNASNISSGTLNYARLPLFTNTQAGAVSGSGGGTSNFLRADGTWAAPPSGGTSPIFVYTTTGAYLTSSTNGIQQMILGNGTLTVTLYTASGNSGYSVTVKNVGSGTVTIATTSSQTIDGSTSRTISNPYGSFTMVSDGSNWSIQ